VTIVSTAVALLVIEGAKEGLNYLEKISREAPQTQEQYKEGRK